MLPPARDDREVSPSSVATRSWGSGEATLVFLHALLPQASGGSIARTATRLTQLLRVRVVGIDGPGFGGSPGLPDAAYELDHMAGLLAQVAKEAAEGPYVVAGHSWGAALAVRIAATHPDEVRGLVLLDGGHFDHADLPDADPAQTVEQTQAEMAELGWRESPASLRAAAAAMTALMRGRSSPSYPAIAASGLPVLLLTATEPRQRRLDNVTRTAHLRAALPRARAESLARCGHDVLEDAPDRVADLIADWWTAELDGR
jgi:pimeloyl-ACP methyl ester carboxylesterase